MTRTRRLRGLSVLLLLTFAFAPHIVLRGAPSSPAPALPAPSGTIINVSTEPQLQAAIQQLASNTTIVLAPGTYQLTSTLYINGTFTNVGIRGATNNRDDVVLQGPGMTNAAYGNTPYGIWTGGNVQGITIANLTIRDLYYHPLIFNPGTDSPLVHNVHLINAGQQFIKGNPDGAGSGVNNGIVEYSVIEYSTTSRDAYTNGVDIHTGANWIIRHNLFKNIVAPAGQLAGPAVLMWNYSSNTLTEGNTFFNCARGIAYGLEDKPNGFDHSGGIIRNNFIFRSSSQPGDVAILVADSPNTKVLNNTAYLSGTYSTPIEYRFADTTGALLENNLLDGFLWARDGATGTELNNLTGATANMFVNAPAGDLHLAASATSAIDHGVTSANVTDDWDGQTRPVGPAQDIGADEYVSGDTTAPTVAMTAPANGAAVSGTTVTVSATATDNVGVVGLQFKLDGVSLGAEDTASPYTLTWNTTTTSNGSHTVTAVARDAAGNTATATAVTVTVSNADTTPPAVSMTAPTNDASVSGSAVTVSATASDNVGVAGVQFLLDGASLGAEDTSTSYSITWNTTSTANGVHSLSARVRDAAGNQTTSASVSVTVANSSGAPPAMDAVAWGDQAVASLTVRTSRFSTTSGDELLLAFVSGDGATSTSVTGVSGAGLTWQLVRRTNIQLGTAEIWRAFASAPLKNVSVTATMSAPVALSITVISFGGVDPSGTNGSGAVGATASTNANPGAPTATLTTMRNNSWVFGVGNDWDTATARTLGPNQTMVHQYMPPVGDTYWVQRTTNPTSFAGTSVTINDVAPTGDRYNLTLCEILAVPVSDTTPPGVSMTAPANGATVSGTAVTVSANATDNVGVVGVQFKLDGVNLGAEDTATPYSTTWNTTTASNGSHTLTAVARDAAGNTATATPVTITVTNGDATPPAVSMTGPANGATVSGTAVTVSATASDNVGVAGVQFKLDGVNLGTEDTATPYSTTWNTTTASNGSHTLTAVARDAAGNTTTATAVTVTVSNGPTVVNVSTEPQLQTAVQQLASNTIINLAPGTYALTKTLAINGTFTNVTITGSTTNRDDVVLQGAGMNNASYGNVPNGISTAGSVQGLTIANLTIRDVYIYPILFDVGTQGPRVSNVHLIDAGQQFIRSNADASGVGADNGIVEDSVIEYTTTSRDANTNGVDVLGGANWIIRDNLFRNIVAPTGQLAGPAVLAVAGSSNTVTERNTFLNCARGVAYGIWDPPGIFDHTGGIIQNNMVYRSGSQPGDVGIIVADSPSTQVLNNTVFLSDTYATPIEYRFAGTTGVMLTNNLLDGSIAARDGATGTLSSNLTGATASLFVNAAAGDLHLLASATAAIDHGATVASVTDDWDGQARPAGAAYDIGADEDVAASDTTAPTASMTAPANGATVSGSAVTLSATASDNVGVVGVQFKVDGINLGTEDTASPYTKTWNTTTASNGSHTVTAVARDAAGNTTTATAVTVTVNNTAPDTVPPTVSMTAPASGATVSGSAVTVSATASDNVGVVGVQFLVDGLPVGSEDTAAPYSIAWNTTSTSNGGHTVAAKARDAAGNVTTSAGVTVTVANGGGGGGGSLVQASNLVYQGAFRLPGGTIGASTFGYGGYAIAFNAARNSLFAVGHDQQQLVTEVTIPAITNSGSVTNLATASMLQPFTDATEGKLGSLGAAAMKVGGLLPYQGKLYIAGFLYYDASKSQVTSHVVSGLDLSVTGDVRGPYQVGTVGAGFISGYFGTVPAAWQSALGGPILNGNCCLSIISRTSYGPAVFTIDPTQLGTVDPLPANPLVYYPSDHHTLGDWNVTSDVFNGATEIRGVVFPEGTSSVLFFGRQGLGPFCYGTGGSSGGDCYDPADPYKGTHAYPYSYYVWAYDANDLAGVKSGLKQPWDVTPYAVWSLSLPFADERTHIQGATYDAATNRIFVSQAFGDGDQPVIHVFSVRVP